MAWGLARFDLWDPIVGAPIPGVHVSPILIPLGWLGLFVDQVHVLLAFQVLCLYGVSIPLSLFVERRLGRAAAITASGAWFLYPTLFAVCTFEFHPGSCAVLPIALCIDAWDRGDASGFLRSGLSVLLFREDLAILTVALGLLGMEMPGNRRDAALARAGMKLARFSAVYFLLFVLVVVPLFGPARGSLSLHFGKWGDSVGEILLSLITQPRELALHLFSEPRLRYLGLLLAPLLGLPLVGGRLVLCALPVLGINLLSEWPTAVAIDSHYQTALLPVLHFSAWLGAERVARAIPRVVVLIPVLVASAASSFFVPGGLLSLGSTMDTSPFRRDPRSAAAADTVRAIPSSASVQAPYPLMPHLAKRPFIWRAPPPDHNPDYAILDLTLRHRFAQSEDILRTEEEPTYRHWLGRPGYGVSHVSFPYVVVQRGIDVRTTLGQRYLRGTGFADDGVAIADCLAVREAWIRRDALTIRFVAKDACPNDLAIRLGSDFRPERVDLLCDGLLMPSHFERGDVIDSIHPVSSEERQGILQKGLRVGALRSSGTRPTPRDPVTVHVPLASRSVSVWYRSGRRSSSKRQRLR